MRVSSGGDLTTGPVVARARAGDDAARRADVGALRDRLARLDQVSGTPRPAAVDPVCRAVRAALYEYVTGGLAPSRQRRLEAHLDACPPCTRAFVAVREESWALRDRGRGLAARGHEGGRHRRPRRRPRF
ncbi:zf-HC2 domain-containing protein [Promicromonospora citrea]|uniref:zf-HC2 domain-containing protein n=1 Tax=Promicromonospora citrea TaxID=43677 RepID=UPI0014897246|nr:zf-HC2 domain-containing protein [Promicromonospora citrea]NNH53478.1 zf-HC2 domain-containing protein [Promicromonospora citrea]